MLTSPTRPSLDRATTAAPLRYCLYLVLVLIYCSSFYVEGSTESVSWSRERWADATSATAASGSGSSTLTDTGEWWLDNSEVEHSLAAACDVQPADCYLSSVSNHTVCTTVDHNERQQQYQDDIQAAAIEQDAVSAAMWARSNYAEHETWNPYSPCNSGDCGGMTANTPISTPTGLRAIQSLALGDRVFSYNQARGTVELSTVTAVYGPMTQPLVALSLSVDDQPPLSFCIPASQPLFLSHNGSYVPAGQLGLFAVPVLSLPQRSVHVSVARESLSCAEQAVYQLEVEPFHSYYVGRAAFLVHNAKPRDLTAMSYKDRGSWDVDDAWTKGITERYLYRALSPAQELSYKAGKGIVARYPGATMSPNSHLAGGLDQHKSNWISASKSLNAAGNFGIRAGKSGGGLVVRIDMNAMRSYGSTILDLSSGEGVFANKHANLAKRYQEVLFDGHIPRHAMSTVGRVKQGFRNGQCTTCSPSRLNGVALRHPAMA